MIFISHNSKDKPLIESIALALAKAYGTDNVFYDSWSIQPGDGIIDRMNKGLESCKFFFYFVSKNSLNSKMVDLEWQNALYKSVKGYCRFIPVILERVDTPPILMQTLYIDLFSQGLEVAIRQMIDVIDGKNTFREQANFKNLHCFLEGTQNELTIEIRAIGHMEPISRFVLLIKNNDNELTFTVPGESMFTNGFNPNVKLDNGNIFNGQLIGVNRATTPTIPTKILVKTSSRTEIKLFGILHQTGFDRWEPLPIDKAPIWMQNQSRIALNL